MHCKYNVAIGASPDQYQSVSALVYSIDAHHRVESKLCITMFFSVLHTSTSMRYISCMRPTLKNVRLKFFAFNEDEFLPDIRSYGDALRIELMDPYNWYRFYLTPQMFGNPKHPILYLDTDTLVNRPLIDVFHTDFGENDVFAAVLDARFDNDLSFFLCADNPQYLALAQNQKSFNAGVMLMNLHKWEQHRVLDRWTFLKRTHDRLRQDGKCGIYTLPGQVEMQLLNISFKTLPFIYNTHDLGCESDNPTVWRDRLRFAQSGFILHYNGENKPWATTAELKDHQTILNMWRDHDNPVCVPSKPAVNIGFIARNVPHNRVYKLISNIKSWSNEPYRLHFHVISNGLMPMQLSACKIHVLNGFRYPDNRGPQIQSDGLDISPAYSPRSALNTLTLHNTTNSCTKFVGTIKHTGPAASNGATVKLKTARGWKQWFMKPGMSKNIIFFFANKLSLEVDDNGNPDFDWLRLTGNMFCKPNGNNTRQRDGEVTWYRLSDSDIKTVYADSHRLIDHRNFDEEHLENLGLDMKSATNPILKSKHYMLKLFLPYILSEVDSLITLDLDVFLQADIIELNRLSEELFATSSQLLFLYVGESSNIYERAYETLGLNGGVVVYNLKRMRQSALYTHFLRVYPQFINSDCLFEPAKENRPSVYKCMWDLIDQTLLTLLKREHPEVAQNISCGWNVQTNLYWSDFGNKYCAEPVKLIHANHPNTLKRAFYKFIPHKHMFAHNYNAKILEDAYESIRSANLDADEKYVTEAYRRHWTHENDKIALIKPYET